MVLSLDSEEKSLILLGTENKSILSKETAEGNLYFDARAKSLYMYENQKIFALKIYSSYEYFQRFVKLKDAENAIKQLQKDETMFRLEFLHGLCRLVFHEKIRVSADLLDFLTNLVEKLETEDLVLKIDTKPDIKNDFTLNEFEELSKEVIKVSKNGLVRSRRRRKNKLTAQEILKIIIRRNEINKSERIQIMKLMGRKKLIALVIKNYLLVVILKKQDEIKKLIRFKEIACKSYDKQRYQVILPEINKLTNLIHKIL